MRCILVIVVLVLLSACASQLPDITACTEPRPQVCTMAFAPVCAVLKNDRRKEFSSHCTACSDPAVTGYVMGTCPE